MRCSLIMVSAVLGVLTALPGHSQDIEIGDIKAATDGRCDYWLPMLAENRSETVYMTLKYPDGSKIKILADGDRWRQVLLVGDDNSLGCVVTEGNAGVTFREGEGEAP